MSYVSAETGRAANYTDQTSSRCAVRLLVESADQAALEQFWINPKGPGA